MKNFDWIEQRAIQLKGSAAAVQALMPEVADEPSLLARSDAEYLSQMGLRIFRAGLKHSVVDAKWPLFEEAYAGFNLAYVAGLSDEKLEQIMRKPGLIAHWGKHKALRHNATWLAEIVRQHGSVGRFLADWPVEDISGLWLLMKKQGAHLGGASAAAFLRMVGKDTFRLSEDVLVQLRALGVLDKAEFPGSQRDLATVQQAFNTWHRQSGLPMAHISRMLSFT